MKLVIAGPPIRITMGDLCVSNQPEDVLVTYALGSCIAVIVHDLPARTGGMAHVQFPSLDLIGQKSEGCWSSADRAVPELLQRAYAAGASKRTLRILLAGGATVMDSENVFQIGKKNYVAIEQILRENGLEVSAETVGGSAWRTVRLEIGSGRVEIQTANGRQEL